ncbi:hypothetical protein FB567DRAFT_576913 [Paraphoma chrysanthemicola]|uniref:DUF6594 domain-containing protein n=1 Tax=Paraphoma chrysanthemicola TaxID=798071 RepID=A0A8K0W2I6_9PLEO|nr:hypothetical protein FB567DRAFT_576913 [Paraphoma chrysanthemicola]
MEARKHEGYQSLSTWMASDDDFFVFRRFESLEKRRILWKQDRICTVEAELELLDDIAEEPEEENGDWYHEAMDSSKDRERKSRIQDMLSEYDRMLVHHRDAEHLTRKASRGWSDDYVAQTLISWLKASALKPQVLVVNQLLQSIHEELFDDEAHFAALREAIWKSHDDSADVSVGTHRGSRATDSILATLLAGSLISPVHAQSTTRTANDLRTDWKQRALNTLTDHLVLSASLPVPVIVCAGSVITARRFYKNRREDKASLLMLGTAVLFVSSSRSSDADTADVDRPLFALSNCLVQRLRTNLKSARNSNDILSFLCMISYVVVDAINYKALSTLIESLMGVSLQVHARNPTPFAVEYARRELLL